MSLVPAGRGDHQGCQYRWQAIMHAIDDTGRTIRLCAIVFMSGLALVLPVVITLLLRHYL